MTRSARVKPLAFHGSLCGLSVELARANFRLCRARSSYTDVGSQKEIPTARLGGKGEGGLAARWEPGRTFVDAG